MPIYTLKCFSCEITDKYFLSIQEFKGLNLIKCSQCQAQELSPVIEGFSSKVKRRSYEIVEEAVEEAAKIREKIDRGDVSTIRNIFGENE